MSNSIHCLTTSPCLVLPHVWAMW